MVTVFFGINNWPSINQWINMKTKHKRGFFIQKGKELPACLSVKTTPTQTFAIIFDGYDPLVFTLHLN